MQENPEHLRVVVAESHDELSRRIASRIAAVIAERRSSGRRAVLGLATGSTPIGVYRELVRLHAEEGLDWSGVVTFNLDEYFPMAPDSPQSYHRFMWENLFDHLNIDPRNVHIPRGDIPRDQLADSCHAYEEAIAAAGGIDFQLLGIGQTGHIGFNEPGSSETSRTRLVVLDTITRRTAASDFFGAENVPAEAVTMGVATILEAREVALLATGEHKSGIIRRAVEGEIDRAVAATFLQRHPNAAVYLDTAAAAELTRIKTPWLLGEVEWNDALELDAVVWLAGATGKSVLKLDDADYRDHHLTGLVTRHGSPAAVNGLVFNALTEKVRGRSRLPRGKRVLVFSPHPDDDVISAGGVIHKLIENGNEITVAYQTSGNIAVFDHEARRYLDFMRRTACDLPSDGEGVRSYIEWVEGLLGLKSPGEMDPEPVLRLKQRIREAEAVSAITTLGIAPDRALFLNLPFYRTGCVRKDPIGDRDVNLVVEALAAHRPEILLVAGDLSDPHGTHRMCKEAIDRALALYEGPRPEVWLYRGAWQEWPVAVADMLIPMSEEELRLKISAIFKHQSQKDRAPFPGVDEREFWQRVEERNKGTAAVVDRLGLPEYFAMEALVVERAAEPKAGPPAKRSDVGKSTTRA
jgi:glucosamine-6-phosphate deaminase